MLHRRVLLTQVGLVQPILELRCVLQYSALALGKVLLLVVIPTATFALLAQLCLAGRIRPEGALLDYHGVLGRRIRHVFLDPASCRAVRLAGSSGIPIGGG